MHKVAVLAPFFALPQLVYHAILVGSWVHDLKRNGSNSLWFLLAAGKASKQAGGRAGRAKILVLRGQRNREPIS